MADAPRRGRSGGRRRWSPLERELRQAGQPLVAGVDEVGRGPLAGPVVACAVVMPPDARAIAGVNDSKQLTAAERVRLAALIRRAALAVGLGAASVREIDRLNIYHASTLAMRRALARLGIVPDHVLIDGRPIRGFPYPHTALVKGDARCYSIACASIVAKVTRDLLMARLSGRHPGYDWARNAGYATPEHIAGLDRQGVTPHHRRSFTRVGQLVLALSPADLDAAAETAALIEAEGAAAALAAPAAVADLARDLATPPADPTEPHGTAATRADDPTREGSGGAESAGLDRPKSSSGGDVTPGV
ncbi:MAG: ribonuclease HII [Gemmatimonadaceae bacterium]